MRALTGSARRTALAAAAATLVLVAVLAASPVLDGLERRSVDARFTLRGAEPTDEIVVVGIDEDTFTELATSWPFPRRLHARMIDRLRRAGVRRTVYDVQFTEPSGDPRADLALFDAAGRDGRLILASGESDARGRTRVLGGPENLAEIGATAAASNFPSDRNGVIRQYEHRVGRLESIAAATARALGRDVRPDGRAWIDFRGPAGTIRKLSFSDVLEGRVPGAALRGRIAVVGATAPVLQDLHPVAGSGRLMSGPELQANAIWTALHGDPLRAAPVPTGWLAAALLGLGGALLVVLAGPMRGGAGVLALAAGHAGIAQLAFSRGLVVPVALPLAALVVAGLSGVAAGAVAERAGRRLATRRNEELEAAVRERTADLAAAQLEMAMRLAQAAELRDGGTGQHIDRMSRLCERLGLELGLPATEAELLRHAAVLHDVGKIGLPDGILRKPGRLTHAEQQQMRRHTTEGAALLAASRSPLLRLAEVIARTHHERWDGSGYPAGLRGPQIPLPGRIAAACDVFDALISARPYKPAWTLAEACEEIARQRGTHLDPAVADALLRVVRSPGGSVDAGAEGDVDVGAQEDDAPLLV